MTHKKWKCKIVLFILTFLCSRKLTYQSKTQLWKEYNFVFFSKFCENKIKTKIPCMASFKCTFINIVRIRSKLCILLIEGL